MSRNNLPDHWDAQEHPSLDMLRQYQTGELPAPLHHQLEQHLASCELCSDLLEGMTLSQPARVKSAVRETRGRLKNLLAQKKRKRKTFQWPIWQTAAVLLVLLFAVAEVVYHHYFAKPAHFQTQSSQQQTTWQLNGKVSNTYGEEIAGATVKLKDNAIKSTTNQQGEFSIPVTGEKSVIIVSKEGYVPQKVPVQKSSPFVEIVLSQTP